MFVVYVLFSICSRCECLRCWYRMWTIHVHITQSHNTAKHVQHISSGCSPLLLLLLLWFKLLSVVVDSFFRRNALECETMKAIRMRVYSLTYTHSTRTQSVSLSLFFARSHALSWSLGNEIHHKMRHRHNDNENQTNEQPATKIEITHRTWTWISISAKCGTMTIGALRHKNGKERARFYVYMHMNVLVFMTISYTLLTHTSTPVVGCRFFFSCYSSCCCCCCHTSAVLWSWCLSVLDLCVVKCRMLYLHFRYLSPLFICVLFCFFLSSVVTLQNQSWRIFRSIVVHTRFLLWCVSLCINFNSLSYDIYNNIARHKVNHLTYWISQLKSMCIYSHTNTHIAHAVCCRKKSEHTQWKR